MKKHQRDYEGEDSFGMFLVQRWAQPRGRWLSSRAIPNQGRWNGVHCTTFLQTDMSPSETTTARCRVPTCSHNVYVRFALIEAAHMNGQGKYPFAVERWGSTLAINLDLGLAKCVHTLFLSTFNATTGTVPVLRGGVPAESLDNGLDCLLDFSSSYFSYFSFF